MLDGLKAALDATKESFAYMAWSKAPSGDYGTYYADGQEQLRTNEESASETMARGYVDFFCRTNKKAVIEAALNSLNIWWELESVQFEPDTGYIHYEWRWVDTNGNAENARP